MSNLFIYISIAVGYFTLGRRLGALNIGNVPKDCQDIIDNTQIFIDSIQKAAFSPPLHKIYPTKLWKQLVNSQDQVSIILHGVLSIKHLLCEHICSMLFDSNTHCYYII